MPDAEKICSCCRRAKDRIGEEVTRILEYVPSKLEVHEHVRPKYACRYCKDGVSSPPPPQRPIARGIAGPGLIAQIVVSKFGDHLPLYRQEDIGRKNWLFLGSQDAGSRAAVLYTILAGAKRHRLEPWAYVRELLMRRHADDARLEDMLPDHWAAQHPESVLTYRLEESRNKAAITRDRRSRRRAQAKSR